MKEVMMEDRSCRKCGEVIPNRIKIDGKYKSLRSRKFCTKCSPYGRHNTKKDIDSPKSVRSYKDMTDRQKKRLATNSQKRGKSRKIKLIEMSGGQCIICGYSKCDRALTFHHRNPEEKCFGLTQNMLWAKSWECIVEEWKKCDMYCIRCHTELEDGCL
jgi:hypothetical protein